MSKRKSKNKSILPDRAVNGYHYHETIIDIPELEISKKERDSSIGLMRSIFEVQSKSYDTSEMLLFLVNFLKELNDKTVSYYVDELGNLYVQKGSAKTFPCIVSHIDTVHRIIPKKDYVVLNSDTEFFAMDLSTRSNTGIGGDDNCGIYTCLDNLIKHDNIKLGFFVDEEIGCVGSSQADMGFFSDVSFVLQADRQGYSDVASDIMYTEMFGVDFLEKIEATLDSYKRKICEGGMTDVMQLAHNGLDVAMANFSCGYYNPHSRTEYVVIDELILTSILFRDIIKVAYVDGEINTFIREGRYNSNYYDKDGNGRGWGSYDSDADTGDYYGYGTGSAKHSFNGKNNDVVVKKTTDHECSFCGCQTINDPTMELEFCNNCMDYDYPVGN